MDLSLWVTGYRIAFKLQKLFQHCKKCPDLPRYPFDRQQVLKRIRVSDEEIIRAAKSHLGSSFIAVLEQNVGIGKAPSTRSQNR